MGLGALVRAGGRVMANVPHTVDRTGPVGRLARLILLLAFVYLFFSFVDARGSARFRNPHVLTEPIVWFFTALLYVMFVILVGAVAAAVAGPRTRRKWQLGGVIAWVVVIAVAAFVGVVIRGSAWGFPLADIVWWFDVLVIVEQVVAFALVIALGTAGCEIGVWGVLLARARAKRRPRRPAWPASSAFISLMPRRPGAMGRHLPQCSVHSVASRAARFSPGGNG